MKKNLCILVKFLLDMDFGENANWAITDVP
jgi:hypothetical protein